MYHFYVDAGSDWGRIVNVWGFCLEHEPDLVAMVSEMSIMLRDITVTLKWRPASTIPLHRAPFLTQFATLNYTVDTRALLCCHFCPLMTEKQACIKIMHPYPSVILRGCRGRSKPLPLCPLHIL